MNCLDEDAVLAFVDGQLDDLGRSAVEGHISGCESCSDLVATAAGGTTDALAASGSVGAESTGGRLIRGAAVGRYVILDLVGRGGMGEVYAAYDPQLDRKVALKLLHESGAPGVSAQTARERLLREAKAIARLSHPNVVVVHDAGAIHDQIHGDRVFLAMEFIEGETLAGWLTTAPRTWSAIREVFASAGEGLAAAHEAGLVHRDFKPQNVMVGRDGSVRVMDFGLASDAGGAASDKDTPFDLAEPPAGPTSHTLALTRTGVLLGTPLYMAPEQFLARATDARTDQFSFCVALYEALYGERPFPSDSFKSLLEAVVAGRVREAPQKARVPAFLRKLLLRGLAADPAARHASMPALLEALRADPVRRRRTATIVAVAAMAGLAAVFGVQRVATRGQRMCRGAGDRLAGIWELVEGGQQRSAVHQAFLGTGRTFAEETWNRVSGLFDDYSRRWTAMYTDACEATHVRGDQSGEVLDLRMSCLEGPRGAFKALTEVLSRADPAALVQAVNAAQALPTLERCSDVPALRSVVPPPTDMATRAQVDDLGRRLANLKALVDTGQWPAARRQVVPLVEAVRAVGYQPLLAETLATSAWLEALSGDPAKATRTFEEALAAALAGRRDDIAAESATNLVGATGYYLGRREEAERWQRLAAALRERLGPGHDRLASWFYQNRGITHQRQADYRAALADLDTALALKQKALPANHPDIARTLLTIANVRNDSGDHAAALVAADKAVEIFRSAYGPKNPLLAEPLDIRGESLELLGRYAEAESDLRETVDLSTAWVGADHPWTAIPLTALGKTLSSEGRPREAAPILERALRMRERSEPNPEMVAETRFALAQARWEIGQDRAGALSLAEHARDGYRKMPEQAKHAAEIDAWLADKANPRAPGLR